jgi:hypothetical protein
MPLLDNIDPEKLRQIRYDALKIGDVIAMPFEDVDHDKYCIITGINKDKICTTSVYINSKIHICLNNKPELYLLQIPLRKKPHYKFLNKDSFVNCAKFLEHDVNELIDNINSGNSRVLGSIDDEDLELIRRTIYESDVIDDDYRDMFYYDMTA